MDASEEPTLPYLKWEFHTWRGKVQLDAWAGFQARLGAYGSVSSDGPSEGAALLYVYPQEGTDRETLPEQAAAYAYLLKHQGAIRDAVLEELLFEYPAMQESYGYDEDEQAEFMPDVSEVDDFQVLMGLSSVHLLPVARDGVAYVGFEFGCAWDEEHGFGALTHRNRVLRIGGADVAFNVWMAEQDGGGAAE